MDRIAVALIGAGVIGRIHARNLAARGDARLSWVVDVDAARGRELAGAHGARYTTSVDEALADRDVRAVIVGSSTDVHEAHVLACAAAGKAIYCEKPVSDSLEGARRCVDAVRAAGVVAAIGFNRRFDASHREVHDRIAAGEIGPVELLHLVSRSAGSASPADAARAGGLIREKGTHHYDLACWLARSEPVEVYGSGGCLFEPGYAEFGDVDTAVLVLRFASGARATFSFSRRTAYGFDETLEVFGAKGMLQSLRHRERSVALWQGPHVSESGIHGGWYDRFAPTYVAALAAFFDAVRGGTAMSPDLTDGLRAQAVAEAARESIATGKPVAIETSWN